MSVRNLQDLTEEELQKLADTISDEEFEQLDELSKAALGKYMGKSVDAYDRARHSPAGPARNKTMNKRRAGQSMAAKKFMAKEEEEIDDDEQLDETAAQDSIKPKSMDLARILNQMAGMDHKDITKISDILNQVGKEADKLPGRANAGSNRHSVDAVADAKSATMFSVKEDLASLFEGQEDLSEEFVNKVETIFEAALNMRVTIEREAIMEEAAALVDEQVEEHLAGLEDKLDDYLSYVVEEWKEENAVALESNIRTNQMEAFMEDLLGLMEAHNIDLPEEKVDVVEELMAELDEAKAALNEQIERNIENQKIIDEAHREAAFSEIAEGLAATQIEKLKALAEGIDFTDIDEFKKKVSTLREHHFKNDVKSVSEEIETNPVPLEKKPVAAGPMGRYSAAISQDMRMKR